VGQNETTNERLKIAPSNTVSLVGVGKRIKVDGCCIRVASLLVAGLSMNTMLLQFGGTDPIDHTVAAETRVREEPQYDDDDDEDDDGKDDQDDEEGDGDSDGYSE
jgi:hypothetical protein